MLASEESNVHMPANITVMSDVRVLEIISLIGTAGNVFSVSYCYMIMSIFANYADVCT